MRHFSICAVVLYLACFAQICFAARPLITDDARITTPQSCQIETWVKPSKSDMQFWALPACNPTGNFEFALGTAITNPHLGGSTTDYLLQGKTILKALKPNGWGVGLAIGKAIHQNLTTPGANGLGNTTLYIPLSISSFDDALLTHINIGYAHNTHSSQDFVTWGLGSELKLNTRFALIAESYGDHRSKPFVQTGLRVTVIPDLFQIDTTIGAQLDSSDSEWLTFGIRYTPEHFLK